MPKIPRKSEKIFKNGSTTQVPPEAKWFDVAVHLSLTQFFENVENIHPSSI
jgi:hypothetical protein